MRRVITMPKKPNRIEVRFLERTSLDPSGFTKVVEHFGKRIRLPMIITFDNRPNGNFATHELVNDRHRIHIYVKSFPIYDAVGMAWDFISMLLHEMKHAMQHENAQENKNFIPSKHDEPQYWYSDLEIEARIFQDRNIRQAMRIYGAKTKNCSSDRT